MEVRASFPFKGCIKQPVPGGPTGKWLQSYPRHHPFLLRAYLVAGTLPGADNSTQRLPSRTHSPHSAANTYNSMYLCCGRSLLRDWGVGAMSAEAWGMDKHWLGCVTGRR